MDVDRGWVLLGLFSLGLLVLAGLMYRSVVQTLEELHKQNQLEDGDGDANP